MRKRLDVQKQEQKQNQNQPNQKKHQSKPGKDIQQPAVVAFNFMMKKLYF